MKTKVIVVSGGVISGLGKGITASTIALLLQGRNYRINVLKIDPYLNIDSGTMSPYEHGECYILEDGSETDLDLGNYERFLETNLSSLNSITSGQIYKTVLDNERGGKYLGKTIQMIPHVTDEIIRRIENATKTENKPFDFLIIELGGTVGDIESNIFLEALRQMSNKHSITHVHVSLVPKINREYKTKPTQNSIKVLNSKGIFPKLLVIRCDDYLPDTALDKLSLFSNISKENIIQNVNVSNIYIVPSLFKTQAVDSKLLSSFNIKMRREYNINSLVKYTAMSNLLENELNNELNNKKIAIVGKYNNSNDTYLSIIRAIEHACLPHKVVPEVVFIEDIEQLIEATDVSGIIIPGGFGYRGIDIKLKAIDIAYKNDIPILGICLGFQLMVVYLFKNILGYQSAFHAEWREHWNNENPLNEENKDPMMVIDKMPIVQKKENNSRDISDDTSSTNTITLGGTMRLGEHPINIKPNTMAYTFYNDELIISERHRHRYSLLDEYKLILEKNDNIVISGYSDRESEILEVTNKRFFIGCQFHPEMKTRLNKPSPLFSGLIQSILNLENN